MESFYFLAVIATILLAIFCVFSPFWERWKKKRREAQEKAAKEAQRAQSLKNNGENIVTTVQQVDRDHIGTRGRHPDTGAFLFFTGIRPPGYKQYAVNDVLNVLVDRSDPTNYKMQWEKDPVEIARQLERKRIEQVKRDALRFTARKNKQQPPRLKKQKCPRCHGKRTIPIRCIHCHGKGSRKVIRRQSGKRYVTTERCLACGGSGKTSLRCRVCGGIGEIFIP